MILKTIREDIACVFERDPAARNTFEVLTTHAGLWGVMFHRVSHALSCRGLKWLARVLSNVSRLFTGIEIHPGAKVGRRFFIDHGMGVVIGETAEIGDDVAIYQGVTLGGTSWEKGKRHPTLGNNVVVGAGAKILGPFTVGDNARIGSNAVVVKAVEPNTTVVGIPGKAVKSSASNEDDKRGEIARKMGFDAYGATRDMPDPVAQTLNLMLDHIHLLDNRVEKLCTQVRHLGGELDDEPLPELDTSDLGICSDDKKY